VSWALHQELRRPEHGADHSPPPNVEVKNEWSYISAPPHGQGRLYTVIGRRLNLEIQGVVRLRVVSRFAAERNRTKTVFVLVFILRRVQRRRWLVETAAMLVICSWPGRLFRITEAFGRAAFGVRQDQSWKVWSRRNSVLCKQDGVNRFVCLNKMV